MPRRVKKSQAYLKQKALSLAYFIPLLIIIGIIPLIVYLNVVQLNTIQSDYWLGHDVHYDFFSYYKALWFSGITFLSLGILLYMVFTNRYILYKSSVYIPLGIYAVAVLITYLASQEKSITTLGVMDMYQGVFVLLGYVILVFVIYNMVKTTDHIQYLLAAFIFLGAVTTLIALSQYFGFDIFRTNLGLKLILPRDYHHLADQLAFTFDKYAVYATMFNTNFVGSFAALMIPLAYAIYLYQKKGYTVMLALLFFGAMVFVGFGSNSRAGLLGSASAFILMFIVYRKIMIRRPLFSLMPFAILLGVGLLLNIASSGRVINEIKSLDFFEDRDKATQQVHYKTVAIEDATLTIETSRASFEMTFTGQEMVFSTLDGDPLEVTNDNHNYQFVDSKYEAITVNRDEEDTYLYTVNLYDKSIDIYTDVDGLKIKGYNGDLVVPDEARRIRYLDGYESMFSSRIYLWTRSAPLLTDYFFIGAGPDMFGLVFPQNDVAGRLNAIGFNTVIDKPHNMYLQTGINSGVVALLALITAFIMYIISSIKLYGKGLNHTFIDIFGAALSISVIAYLITGMFNDQIISVAPLFYAMFGLGMAVNRIKKENPN
ncbi:MAG: O-antigen ligase family protein [Bacillota bacterium]